MPKTLLLPGDFDSCSRDELGGKAWQLLIMQNAGLAVPDFFVIPARCVAAIVAGVRKEIESSLSVVDALDHPQLFDIARSIKEKIQGIELAAELQHEIQSACTGLFGPEYDVAVRSSAAAEDGAGASFAGQHESYLFVSADTLISKIRDCIASAWSFGALSYRLAIGISLRDIQYAVIIQDMVKAEKSGIAFSMNGHGNLADAVIVAGYGLGEGIVQDRVETDLYTVDWQQGSVAKKCVSKPNSIQFIAGEGLVNQAVDPVKAAQPALNDQEILQVFGQVMQAEKLLNFPADVEFSFDQSGKLYLLQMRPITTLDLQKLEILDNTNIVESYPGVTLPLSFSFALDAYEKVFTGSSKAFWVSDELIVKNKPVFQNLLAHYYGRIYYRLDNWYRMMSIVHSSAQSMAAWEKAVGLTSSEKDKVPFTFQKRIKTLFLLANLVLNYRRRNKRFFRLFRQNYDDLRNLKPNLQSPEALWKHYETTTALLFKPWYITLVNDFLAFKFFGWLQDLVSTFNLSPNESLANDLLCGTGGVESEEAIIQVLKLKEQVLEDPYLKMLFEKPAGEILHVLETGAFPAFFTALCAHLEKYGDRTLAELKLETPAFRTNPLHFIDLLKNQLATGVGLSDFAARQKEIRSQAETIIERHLRWWNPKTWLFNFVRRMAAYGLKNRENMRFCRTRAYGAVKDLFLETGKMMKKAGLIEQETDVFYLTTNDLKLFCKDGIREPKQEQVRTLKAMYKDFESLQLPDRVLYQQGQLPLMETGMIVHQTPGTLHQGTAVSKGRVTAEAAVILHPDAQLNVQGKILVSTMTDPGWVFLMMQAAGLLSEKGSLLSHTAIVGRELGIPVVVGVKDATRIFKNGDLLTLDGSLGTVSINSAITAKNNLWMTIQSYPEEV